MGGTRTPTQAPGLGGGTGPCPLARAAGDSDPRPQIRPPRSPRSAPPPPAAGGTRIRAPSSGGQVLRPAPLASEGRIWLAPPTWAEADEGHPGPPLRLLRRPRGPRPARHRLHRGSPARAPPDQARQAPSPQPGGPGPSLTQSSVPQLMVQGAGRGAPRGRRGSRVPLLGGPLAP